MGGDDTTWNRKEAEEAEGQDGKGRGEHRGVKDQIWNSRLRREKERPPA